MKGLELKIIQHEDQRYPTVGDWWIDEEGIWHIRVSQMSNWRHEFLVFFHEALEMAWCYFRGIRQEVVDAFDIAYENARFTGQMTEPGDDPAAPYYWGHQVAGYCERIAAHALGVDWRAYEAEIERL